MSQSSNPNSAEGRIEASRLNAADARDLSGAPANASDGAPATLCGPAALRGEVTVSRRGMLQTAAVAAALASAGGVAAKAAASGSPGLLPPEGRVLADDPINRRGDALDIRVGRARANAERTPIDIQPINDDETRFGDFRGMFGKSLQHNANGELEPASYRSLLRALDTRHPADFEAILIGRENDPLRNRLASPQASFAFELSGLDGNANRIFAAPAFDSTVNEAEMAELYWYSVTRDVPFSEYENRNIIRRAADDLNRFSRRDIFPRNAAGLVTPATLFRGTIPQNAAFTGLAPLGTLTGPFVSQFLILPFKIGQLVVDQRYPKLERSTANQFMTEYGEWLEIQRGFEPNLNDPDGNASIFTGNTRFIARMRDLSEWVHRDFPLQASLHALSVIFALNDDNAFDQSLPYLRVNSSTQAGFVSFGLPDISHLAVHAPRQALTGAWFQKWSAHRRLRPEAYGARINRQETGAVNYNIGSELLGSEGFRRAVDETRRVNNQKFATPLADPSNDGLLPMGFPEGSPVHPAYPGGHASFVAAGATVLKAFLNEDYVFQNPQVPNRGGFALEPWLGAPLTIGGELNKLIANVTHARDGAGMHWRSDGVGNLIGEEAGIALLADYTISYNEEIDGLTLRRLNGQRIQIRNGVVTNIAG